MPMYVSRFSPLVIPVMSSITIHSASRGLKSVPAFQSAHTDGLVSRFNRQARHPVTRDDTQIVLRPLQLLPAHSVHGCGTPSTKTNPYRGRWHCQYIPLNMQMGLCSAHFDHHNTYPTSSFRRGPGINFVNKSAMFVLPSSQATLIIPAACASRAR